MKETALELAERLIAEGKSTDEIREILNGRKPLPPRPAAPAAKSVFRPASGAASARVATGSAASLGTGTGLGVLAAFSAWLGWLAVIVVCLVPAVAVFAAAPAAQNFGPTATWILTLGDAAGVIGLAMYVCALVLATRFRWFESIFGGLNRVMTVHQMLGGLSLVAILIHPLLTAGSYYQYGLSVVAHFFVPQLAYIGSAFGILALATMIGLMVFTLYMRHSYRVWLTTHKFMGLVYLLIALHVLLTPNHISAQSFLKWYLYGLLVVGLFAYVYRTLLPNIFVRRYLYTIASAEQKGVGVVEVTLAPTDRRLPFRAGQFIFLSFDNEGLSREWHPFSISSAESSDKLMIDVKSLGAYTETLTRLLPYMTGITVRVEGAYGRFSYRNFGNTNQIWVAGGIGITPFLSMAQALGDGPYNVDLYYSVKTESELIDLNTLAIHQSSVPGKVFRVIPFISEKYNTFLSAKIIAKNSGDLSGRDFLLCGPPPMMHALTVQLQGMGVPKRRIHSEEFALD